MSASKSFHHTVLDQFEKEFPGEVQQLGTYQDDGANVMFRGRPALFLTHGAKSPSIAIRIKKNRGYSLYDNWLKNGQFLNIDLLITAHIGWGGTHVYEAVPWSKVEKLLKRFALNDQDQYNFESQIVTYEDGNQSLILDAYLTQALYRLIRKEDVSNELPN